MGSCQSSYQYGLTETQLEEYLQLTYLTKYEILSLLEMFGKLHPEGMQFDFHQRIPFKFILEMFPPIKHNPFCDRIGVTFSSLKDDRWSFEDLLDFYSVMSERCPENVKALWAFRIYDFRDDAAIDKDDLIEVIDRLTQKGKGFELDLKFKEHISEANILSKKNKVIKELRYELARVCKAHDDLVDTYEEKLVQYGIPKNELGFKPLRVLPEGQSGRAKGPAGLVTKNP